MNINETFCTIVLSQRFIKICHCNYGKKSMSYKKLSNSLLCSHIAPWHQNPPIMGQVIHPQQRKSRQQIVRSGKDVILWNLLTFFKMCFWNALSQSRPCLLYNFGNSSVASKFTFDPKEVEKEESHSVSKRHQLIKGDEMTMAKVPPNWPQGVMKCISTFK